MVAFSAGVSYTLWPEVEYLPEGNRNFVFCQLSPPPGYNIEQLMKMGEELEKDLKPYWDVDPGSPEAEKLDFPPDQLLLLRSLRIAGHDGWQRR